MAIGALARQCAFTPICDQLVFEVGLCELFGHHPALSNLLYQVREHMLSFTSPQDLQNRVECLPDVPRWSHQTIILPGFWTKDPMTLYWRDSLEVVKYLFANPVFA